MEVEKGILVPHLELILPLLHLRHAIHVVFGGSNLQPLTVDELSLVEDIMSGKLGIPSVKEARALLQRCGELVPEEGQEEEAGSARYPSLG